MKTSDERARDCEKSRRYRLKQISMYVVSWHRRTKLKLLAYKGGKCEKCGYDKPYPRAYAFHHLDPDEKDFSISGQTRSFEKLKSEVDKCSLLCVRCHAEEHDRLEAEAMEEKMQKYKKELAELDTKLERECVCGTKVLGRRNRKYCSPKCAKQARKLSVAGSPGDSAIF